MITILFVLLIGYCIYNLYDDYSKKKKETNTITETVVSTDSQVTDLLNKEGLKYSVSDGGKRFELKYVDESKEQVTYVYIETAELCLKFSTVLYYDVPDDSISKVVEVLARMNQYCNLGFYKLFFEDRMIVYQSNYYLTAPNNISKKLFDYHFEYASCIPKNHRLILKNVIEHEEEPVIAMLNF